MTLKDSFGANVKRLCTVPVVYQEPNLTNHQINVTVEVVD